ncbi:helix-turn-helix domain-containing protein [Tepidibacter sp. Z1-5]|uniref:helix-turn-helix domain-containing protein n=1 Tax=Tepidibacter sp. Z1-5 TaxID=3134138 RepID=UPI0030BE108A
MNNICKQFGINIRKYRNEKGYTTAELAKYLNVSAGLVNNIENSKNDVFKLELLLNLPKQLDVSLSDLLPTAKMDIRQMNTDNLTIDISNKTNLYSNEEIDLINNNLNLIINSFLNTIFQCKYTEDRIKTITSHITEDFDFIRKLNLSQNKKAD